MDDIRRPHQPQRRDYTAQPHRPAPQQPASQHSPHHAQPQPQADTAAYRVHPQPTAASHHQLQTYQQSQTHHQTQHHQTQHHQPAPPQSQPKDAAQHAILKRKSRHGLKLAVVILIPFIAAGVFAAGYTLKSTKDANGIPASITKQANFSLYFPSPMPSGYVYMKDTATFQIGQVFYKFANGGKRVTVNEQPAGQNKPDLSQLPGYTEFNSPIGKAALGSTFGQPTAVVLAGTTIITMNTAGGVSPQELQSAVQNLKNIGQNPNPQPNG